MKRVVWALGICAGLLGASASRAEVLDMATLKCGDTASWSEDEAGLVMFWLHGYYGGKANDTRVDLDAITVVAKQLAEACAENPEVGIMSALKSVVGD